ncbi:MAG: glutamine--tRNA ligase/YqeY domain fusion protein [Saprospiraceae bacterium]
MTEHSKIESNEESLNFIEEIVQTDQENNKHGGRVLTRFPPEPNGYLHIGHAKSICLNFGLAQKFGGQTNLRFDDTNPVTEDTEYVDSIREDVRWLGFEWINEFYASDYFDDLYQWAEALIQKGLAYVENASAEEIASMKGTPTSVGTNSAARSRSIEENARLFREMKEGLHDEGSMVLRAKVDMASPNMLMRDPVIYRIKKAHHHRTGDKWCIYPMYDFAHGLSDSKEGITHSICTLEFENHRPLYDWFLEELDVFRSRQIEFARLNLSYTIMSKRKLLELITGNHVSGWDDPRMPTISGLRRRGYTAESIRNFATRIGIAKRENLIDVGLLEFSIREDLNHKAERAMAVLDPVKLIITNYPAGQEEVLECQINPEQPELGNRQVHFGPEIFIEREDFMLDPPKKFFRLGPGLIVRLKNAYIIQCDDYSTDENGKITEIRCSYFPNSKSGHDESGINVKGTLHWVSATRAVKAEVRLYDRLFTDENPAANKDQNFTELINPDSLEIVEDVLIEPYLSEGKSGQTFQFLRKGYFCVDPDSTDDKMVFNRTVTLKDHWAKMATK